MYKVYLYSANKKLLIHEISNDINAQKLKSGKIVKGINTIDSFSFDIYLNNIGFDYLNSFSSLIDVFNEKTQKKEFSGRLLISSPSMEENGLIYKSVICESKLSFLNDTIQPYINPKNWTRLELLQYILDNHNIQVSDDKKIFLGNFDFGPQENIYVGLQYQKSFDAIKEKLIEKIGGEIKIRESNSVLYLDYSQSFGVEKDTCIEIGINLKSSKKEDDPNNFYTRFIPLGAKKKIEVIQDDGTVVEEEIEERITIESVNNNKNYIDDLLAIKKFGIIVGKEYWDDVNEPAILLTKASKFLSERNKIKTNYNVTALDLSLIDNNFDSFELYNYYYLKNKLIGIDDKLRIIKISIDIINFNSSCIEFGEKTKSLSEKQVDNNKDLVLAINTIKKIESDYLKNIDLTNYDKTMSTKIQQEAEKVIIEAKDDFITKESFDIYENENKSKLEILSSSINNEVSETNTKIEILKDNQEKNITKIKESVEQNQTATQYQINIISETLENGVSKVKTNTGYTFGDDGMMISKDGEEMNSMVDNTGLYVKRDYENVLVANNNGVEAENIKVKKYLTIGNHARFENYGDGRTGCFYLE